MTYNLITHFTAYVTMTYNLITHQYAYCNNALSTNQNVTMNYLSISLGAVII